MTIKIGLALMSAPLEFLVQPHFIIRTNDSMGWPFDGMGRWPCQQNAGDKQRRRRIILPRMRGSWRLASRP